MAPTRVEKLLASLFWAVIGLLFTVFRVLSRRKTAAPVRQLPPVTNPLLLISATQLAKKIRRREVRMRPEHRGVCSLAWSWNFTGKEIYKKLGKRKQSAKSFYNVENQFVIFS